MQVQGTLIVCLLSFHSPASLHVLSICQVFIGSLLVMSPRKPRCSGKSVVGLICCLLLFLPTLYSVLVVLLAGHT